MGRASSGSRRAPGKALRKSQQGAAAIFAAIALITLLSAVGLAIDIGQLYYADRNLQRLADLAAIDAARVQSQCLGNASDADINAEVTASLQRNGLPAGTTVVTTLGLRSFGADGLQSFTPTNPGQAAKAVQVTLSRPSPSRLLPLFSAPTGGVLTSRAAASSELVRTVKIDALPVGAGSLKPEFYGPALKGNINLGNGGSIISGSEATVSLDRLVLDSNEVTDQLPDLTVPEPVTGLLSDLEARLNETGDAAAASLVAAFAAAVETGRPGVQVLPSEVLGLPVRGTYEGATSNVGAILDAIAGVVSRGDVIQLPNLCALLPLADLPTAQLLPALCDSTIEASVPQPSATSTTNSSTPLVDLDTSSENAATSAGALLRVRLKLANPLNNQPISLTVDSEARGASAVVREVACARAGLPAHVVTVDAAAPAVRFALGDSASFDANFSSPTANIGSLLDDVVPATVLTATLGEVLSNAGLSGLVGNPLLSGLTGQTVTVRAGIAPFEIGSGEQATLCMEGKPPYPVTTQCNGAPATLGGVTFEEAALQVEQALAATRFTVQLPAAVNNLPAPLKNLVDQSVTALTDDLSAALAPALQLLSPQLIRVFSAANVAVGEAQVTLNGVTVTTPEVFAR